MATTNSLLNSRGLRLTANGGVTFPDLANITSFNQVTSLMTGPYVHELQLVNGYYSTSNYSVEGYRNYCNYYNNSFNYSSNISGIRYVMLSYLNTTAYDGIQRLKFEFTYAPGGAFPIRPLDVFNRFESNITLQYKFISPIESTGWLNGNSNLSEFNDPPQNYINNGISGLNNCNYGTSSNVRVLQIPYGNYSNFQVYVRVGIPMSLPCAFSYLEYRGAN